MHHCQQHGVPDQSNETTTQRSKRGRRRTHDHCRQQRGDRTAQGTVGNTEDNGRCIIVDGTEDHCPWHRRPLSSAVTKSHRFPYYNSQSEIMRPEVKKTMQTHTPARFNPMSCSSLYVCGRICSRPCQTLVQNCTGREIEMDRTRWHLAFGEGYTIQRLQ
jgi:hypothetical protein